MVKKRGSFSESWEILRRNKVLFVPNLLLWLVHLLLFGILMWVSGLGKALFENDYSLLSGSGWKVLSYFLVYVVLSIVIDNFFLVVKYGMIKEVLLKKKTSLGSGFRFGRKHYWTTLGIHVLSFLIVLVPLLLGAALLFVVLPVRSLVAATIFWPLAIVWLIYITMRLIFVYPVMAFEKKGAYNSLKEDFHYVKTHLNHIFLTWLIVLVVLVFAAIVKENLYWMTGVLQNQVVLFGMLGVGLIFLIELAVSLWEHIFLFKSYLAKRK